MAAAGAVRGGTGRGGGSRGAAAGGTRVSASCVVCVSLPRPSPSIRVPSRRQQRRRPGGQRSWGFRPGLGGGGCGASSIFRPGTGRSMRARARGTSAEPPHSETSPPMIPLLRESQSRKYRMDSRHQSHAELSGAEMLGQTRTPAPTTHPPPTHHLHCTAASKRHPSYSSPT